MSSRRLKTVGLAIGAIVAVTYGAVVSADHAWGNYHWARTSNPFDLTIINSTTSDWDTYVTAAIEDWSGSSVLNMVEDLSGSTESKVRRSCSAPAGQVRICNLAYGFNGWLGIAGISIDSAGHIISGYTKLNDSYFSAAYYNKPEWKQSVACQELGHNVGLDHQDEDFDNASLLSCMDYQDPPFEWANPHDFQQLQTIYTHTDSYNSYTGSSGGGGGGGECNAPPGKGCNKAGVGQDDNDRGWGASLGRKGNREKFLRIDPDGTRHITFVTWAEHR
jgi:hypothetical protein